jgi:hypothetical protein
MSDGYLFNDALTNALATQPTMKNDVITVAAEPCPSRSLHEYCQYPEDRQQRHSES